MKRIFFILIIFCRVISISSAQEEPNCKKAPLKSPQQAICFGQWHARVISKISKFGYTYNAEQKDDYWIIRIIEQNPGKDTIVIKIRSHDGSVIEIKDI